MIETFPEYLYDDDLADPDVAELFAALYARGSGAAPAMGADLVALLEATSAPTVLARRRDRRTARRAGAAALLATGLVGVGLGVGAAAVGILPDPAQRVVSDVVGRLTRIELPLPDTSPRQPEPEPNSDSDSGTVAPVDPEEGTTLEPSDPDGVIGPRGTPASPEGGNQDADEEATGEDEGQHDSEVLEDAQNGGTSDGGSGDAVRDSSGSVVGKDSASDSDEDADDSDQDSDEAGDSSYEGRSPSGDGEERGSGDSGSDGADEE